MFTLKNTKKAAKELHATVSVSGITPVFDMDGVFADATHRQICNPDGSLNLEKYREMSTAEHINKDAELPLIEVLKRMSQEGKEFHICTARVMCKNTLGWLESRGITPKSIMARAGEHDCRRDNRLKKVNLTSRFSHDQLKNMVLIDDNLANCQAAMEIGMKAINVPFEGH